MSDAIAREDEAKSGHAHLSAAFVDPKVWLLGLIYFALVCGIYIVGFWLPSIISKTGVSDPFTIGLLTAVPYLVGIVVMVAATASSDRLRERRWHTVVPAVVCGLGLIVTGVATSSTLVAMIGMTLAAAGSSAAFAAFWCIPPAFLTGAAAAAGIALVNSLGNIAGFVSTSLVGLMSKLTHSSTAALYLFGAIVALGSLLVLAIPARVANK